MMIMCTRHREWMAILLQSNNRRARVSHPFPNLTCHRALPHLLNLSCLLKTNTLIRNGEGLVPGLHFLLKVWGKNMFAVIDIGVAHCPGLKSHVLKEPKYAPTNALQIDGQKPRSCIALYVVARCHILYS